MKATIGDDVRELRHSLSDRLRAVECPAEFIKNIMEWTTVGVGQAYGTGYSLELQAKWMGRI